MSQTVEDTAVVEGIVNSLDESPANESGIPRVSESSEREPTAEIEDDGFKPIGSQEEFDAAIRSRLERANKSAEKKYLKQVEELNAKIQAYEEAQLSAEEKKDKRLSELEQSLAEATDRYTKLERTRLVESLAREMGLPEKFWSRVQGATDDEIISDINDMLEGLPRSERTNGVPSQQPKVSVSATDTEPEVEENPKSIVDKIGGMFPF